VKGLGSFCQQIWWHNLLSAEIENGRLCFDFCN